MKRMIGEAAAFMYTGPVAVYEQGSIWWLACCEDKIWRRQGEGYSEIIFCMTCADIADITGFDVEL